jgi:hypothetical protein
MKTLLLILLLSQNSFGRPSTSFVDTDAARKVSDKNCVLAIARVADEKRHILISPVYCVEQLRRVRFLNLRAASCFNMM